MVGAHLAIAAVADGWLTIDGGALVFRLEPDDVAARLRQVVLLDTEAVRVDGGQLVESHADLEVARDHY